MKLAELRLGDFAVCIGLLRAQKKIVSAPKRVDRDEHFFAEILKMLFLLIYVWALTMWSAI